ncbi:MoxR family ATPase [bacterium]|nr:MAG: MoxR family ATPase [bacterium]
MSKTEIEKKATQFAEHFQALKKEIGKVVVGQHEAVELLLLSLFSKGHSVLVGVPGLAKTLLVKTVSEALNLSFNRIQFTPDLMPGDITGTEIIDEDETGHKHFKFIKGPIFSNLILADEINRTPPKTQAALLEAMQESRVTVAGKTYNLEAPFFVLATQNPIEQEGTYPLPEAQLDRFMFNLWLDYPSYDEEIEIVSRTTSSQKTTVEPVLNAADILEYQQLIREVSVPDSVTRYVVDLVTKTRPNSDRATEMVKKYISWGAGPRASQNLIIASKALALSEGRFFVNEKDVQKLAVPTLRHRVVVNYSAEAENISLLNIINTLL